jgi:uncharacterized protein (TIGR03437 family)
MMPVAQTAPGIVSVSGNGRGQALVLRNGIPAPGAAQPVERGDIVTLYATGTGLLDNSVGDGMVVRGISHPLLPVSARIGGQHTGVLYAGTSPGLLEAVLQINVRVPQTAPQGADVPMELIAGNGHSQIGLTMFVK